MNKLVYLHELDSVRNTSKEIELGQQAMYQEIVMNGNCVVLSYNQFVDSKAFLCSVKNEEQYPYILELFRKGYIKLSNFRWRGFDIYTPSQYIQYALDKNIKGEEEFIFSGIPLELHEVELMTVMRDALKYSNTSVFDTYKRKPNEDEARIQELIKFTRLLLAVSVEDLAYNPIVDKTPILFSDLMMCVCMGSWDERLGSNEELAKLFPKAIKVLESVKVKLTKDKINGRSNWLEILYQKEKLPEVELAEAIVHMVYNYVVEDSIRDVAKHYDESNGIDGLLEDFAHRIQIYWTEHIEKGLHEIHNSGKGAEGADWDKILSWQDFPEWETAARVVDKKAYIKTQSRENMPDVLEKSLYEDNYETDRKKWRRKLVKTIFWQIVIAVAYIILIHIFNQLTGGVESIVDLVVGMFGLNLHPVLSALVNLVIYTGLLGVFSSYVAKIFNLPDILESIDDIGNGFQDIKNIRAAKKYVSYVWLKEKDDAKK